MQKICFFVSFLSLGKYNMKLYSSRRDSYSTLIGGLISILCYIGLLIYSIFSLKLVIDKDVYNLDAKPAEFQAFGIKLKLPEILYHPYYMPCRIPQACYNQTIGQIATTLLNNSFVDVEFPFGDFGTQTNCSSLYVNVTLLNLYERYDSIMILNSSNFVRNPNANTCNLLINKTLIAFNETTFNDLYSIQNQDQSSKFRLAIDISGVPSKTRVYTKFQNNMEITQGG